MGEIEKEFNKNLNEYRYIESLTDAAFENSSNNHKAAAESLFEDAIKKNQKNLSVYPNFIKVINMQYRAYEELGIIRNDLHDFQSAETYFRKGLDLLEVPAKQYDDNVVLQFDLMRTVVRLASVTAVET